jgi:undecaprenyl-diphosphatase
VRTRRWALAAGAIGLGAGWVRTVVLPRRPDDAGYPIPRRIPDPDLRPSPDGTGVRIVVNPSSGPAWRSSPTEALREGLPGADIHELEPDDDLAEMLCHDEFVAIGAAGGDGTLGAVAVLAAERDLPLVAVPAGTLNHLARDLGLDTVDDAIAAVRAGTAAHMDLGTVGDRCFVNTLTFGGYTQLVDTRERLESRIGKWPALAVALAVELPRMAPLQVEIDGRPMRVWVAWIGNCHYDPPGFAPAWRESLSDGLLDVRFVHGSRRFSRLRFLVDVLTGRLASCPVYEQRTATTLRVRSLEGPLRLAADGETFDGEAELVVAKRPKALLVAVPPYEDDDAAGAREGEAERAEAGVERDSQRPTSTASPTSTTTPATVSHTPPDS